MKTKAKVAKVNGQWVATYAGKIVCAHGSNKAMAEACVRGRGSTKSPVKTRDTFPLAMAKIGLAVEAINYERYDVSGDERSRAAAWRRLMQAARVFVEIEKDS